MEVFQKVCSKMEESSQVKNTSESFRVLRTDEERVAFSIQVLKDYDVFPLSFESDLLGLKSLPRCIALRTEGNEVFKTGDNKKALLCYTKSVAYAPCVENEGEVLESMSTTNSTSEADETVIALSLALANRSAVLFKMKKFEPCLDDISRAFHYHYPAKLKYKLYERRAKCQHMLGKTKEASESFKNALNSLSVAEALTEEKKVSLEYELRKLCSTFARLACKEKEVIVSLQAHSDGPFNPKVSYNQNPVIPCSSDCIELKDSADMGRGLFATRDIAVGDILAIETPFASILLEEFYYSHCYHCYTRCNTLLPCLYCSQVMFCSEECRTLSWKDYHHIDCSLLPYLHNLKVDKMGLLALRIVILALLKHSSVYLLHETVKTYDQNTSEFNEEGHYDSSDYRTIFNLVTNIEKRTVANLFTKSVIAACILDCIERKTDLFATTNEVSELASKKPSCSTLTEQKHFLGGLILRHLQNLPCNAHEVTEAVMSEATETLEPCEIGAAAYATMSLINHSCDPNVVRHSFDGDKVVLRAIRRILKGEQVLDNYGYHYATTALAERQSQLLDHYFFTCNCVACQYDWPKYLELRECDPLLKCQGCQQTLPGSNSSANEVLTCSKCNHANSIVRMKGELTMLSQCFSVDLQCLLSGSYGDYINKFICYLTIFDRYVVRPWKTHSDCQEALKQCFLKLTYNDKNDTIV